MTEPALSLEEAAAHLGEVVERARSLGESTVLTVDGKAVARVVPVGTPCRTMGELADWLATRERLDPEEAEAFAADVEAGRRESNVPPKSPWD